MAAWKALAACRGTDPALFFPAGTTGVALDDIVTAKAICQGCQVRRECLEFAFDTDQEAGIWGGMTEEERRRVQRFKTGDYGDPAPVHGKQTPGVHKLEAETTSRDVCHREMRASAPIELLSTSPARVDTLHGGAALAQDHGGHAK